LKSQLVSAGGVAEWLAAQPPNLWVSLLQEAAGEYAAETGSAEVPREHFIEWLAEWGREVRRRQTGLMLLTAHRAKGLEFDHVAVLDGGWEQVSRGEDADAPRRLFYVAMTRAKCNLILARFDRRHALLDALPESQAILHRASAELPRPAPELARHHQRLGLQEVNLGFAGHSEVHRPIHRAIAALSVGSALQLKREGDRWVLQNENGSTVGRLAASYKLPDGMECIAARVAAIAVWHHSDTKSEYQHLDRCDRWEVVVPEFVFAPSSL